MKWYKDILHLFTKLSEQSFHNILAYGTIARAVTNLVVSTIVLYGMTYALPLLVKAIAPMLGIKRMTGFAHFDMVSAIFFNFSDSHRNLCYMALTYFIRW